MLAHRGDLGLDDAEVKQLEERDAALQRRLAEIRERFGAEGRSQGGRGRGSALGPPAGEPPDLAPGGGAGPGGPAPGGRFRGGGGYRRSRPAGHPARDPAARAAELRRRLDDADTAAWLEAEDLLREPHREPARQIAEKYREALADERDAEQRRP